MGWGFDQTSLKNFPDNEENLIFLIKLDQLIRLHSKGCISLLQGDNWLCYDKEFISKKSSP